MILAANSGPALELSAVEAALELTAYEVAHPLACARCWDRAPPRTSQRRCLQDPRGIVLVAGGNRSGKTTLAAQLAVAVALGSDDLDVQSWAAANVLDLRALVPNRGPGDVWAVALDSGDSREYVRPAIAALCPAGATWRNRDGTGYAEVRLPSGGRIGFKGGDEGRDGFQGTAKDLIWFDEEPAEAVVDEAMMRLADRRGRLVITLTPLKGRTWIWHRWVAEPHRDVAVHQLHGADNPHLPQGALAAILSRYGAHQQAARARGEFALFEGLVYTFDRRVHVVPSFACPESWPRYGGIDFGARNPFCFLRVAHDLSDDVLHVIAEHYQANMTLRDHVAAMDGMRRADRNLALAWCVADPEERQSRIELASEHGIDTRPAQKGVRDGLNAVAERLDLDVLGRPHLVVHDCCPHVIREFEGYVWDPAQGRADQRDAPLKRADHAMDVIRYVAMELRAPHELPEAAFGWLGT